MINNVVYEKKTLFDLLFVDFTEILLINVCESSSMKISDESLISLLIFINFSFRFISITSFSSWISLQYRWEILDFPWETFVDIVELFCRIISMEFFSHWSIWMKREEFSFLCWRFCLNWSKWLIIVLNSSVKSYRCFDKSSKENSFWTISTRKG